jgi:hypothetical protein
MSAAPVNPITELFGQATHQSDVDWAAVVTSQRCPYLGRTCIKVRKSEPSIAIGTCSVQVGSAQPQEALICPHRFLERGQIFFDCLHLLTRHEPGNELHCIPEISVPGGSVDYVLASTRAGKVLDFVGIELQALDTTGTLWPLRQNFLHSQGALPNAPESAERPYGLNWKMTAKTTLVQLHHKVETFEVLGKHLVLVVQDVLLAYMQREFNFAQVSAARLGDSMHFHAYGFQRRESDYHLQLASRFSTDSNGLAAALGLQVSAKVEMEVLIAQLEGKLSAQTRLQI